jgi:putative FmdB family regulatory protein
MPIYEFRCTACGHEFEATVGYGKTADCPECQAIDTNRKISLFSAPRAPSPPAAPTERPYTPPGMEGAPEFIDCVFSEPGVSNIYAPGGGRGIFRRSKLQGGNPSIDAGGDAEFYLEDTDVEET